MKYLRFTVYTYFAGVHVYNVMQIQLQLYTRAIIEILCEFLCFQMKLKEVVLSNQSSPLPQKRDCK